MTQVLSPIVFPAAHDPRDRAEYLADFSRLLDSGEKIATLVEVVPYADAIAGGLLLDDLQLPALNSSETGVVLWVSFDRALWEAAAYDLDGARFNIEITILTDQQRRYQRTYALNVKQQ